MPPLPQAEQLDDESERRYEEPESPGSGAQSPLGGAAVPRQASGEIGRDWKGSAEVGRGWTGLDEIGRDRPRLPPRCCRQVSGERAVALLKHAALLCSTDTRVGHGSLEG